MLIAGAIESWLLGKWRRMIPIRIHVNGTRGKSTVTRLIAATLREAGITTVARTTGTAARHILKDGSEVPVNRGIRPSILEIRETLELAFRTGAEALVIECMALNPEYQRAVERKFIQSTIGVITNVRPDHLDVMGPSLADAARAIASTIPTSGILVTGEKTFLSVFRKVARKRGTRTLFVERRDEPTCDGLSGFNEFPENEALVRQIASLLGIGANVADNSIKSAAPDPGAVRLMEHRAGGRSVRFLNAFAANDPVSTDVILNRFWGGGRYPDTVGPPSIRILLYNHRSDRPNRTELFIPAMEEWVRRYQCAGVVVNGSGSVHLKSRLSRLGIRAVPGGITRSDLWNDLGKACNSLDRSSRNVEVVGIGNIHGEVKAFCMSSR